MAQALLASDNQKKLKFRQECGQIARIFTKKKGYQVPGHHDRFIATIRAQGPLPSTISAGMKLARQFFDYPPQSAAIMSEETAYLTFRSQDQLKQFITATHGLALPTGEILSVQDSSSENRATESENSGQKEKQGLRERKRLERNRSEVEDLGSLFS